MVEFVTSRNSSKYLRKVHQKIVVTQASRLFYEERQDSVVGV